MAKSKTKQAEPEELKDEPRAPGTTTIAPSVLVRIAQLTSLSVPGVAGMAPVPGGVNRLFRRGVGDGVRIELDDNSVAVDLYLTVGMKVTRVDIYIEEIEFEHEA
jgi:uncharacterized alkaline shock family protein YloU